VTGATGYIGGRLVPQLLEKGYRVRAIARSLTKLQGRPWSSHSNIELVQADLMAPDSLESAIHGCQVVYYLVHSMISDQKDFANADRIAAKNLLEASENAGVKRIIYLGGLGWDQPNTSNHLKSRYEVGDILQSGNIAVTRFRAAQIIGSGSACYEIIRYLFERLPIFIIPESFINTRLQPISIRNVLIYLVECLKKPETENESFEIGGPDVLTYRELFYICAEEKGLKKPAFINAPKFDLGQKLGFALVKFILPLPSSISQPLFEGLAVQVVLKDHRITRIIPQDLITCREAIRRAIQADTQHLVQSRWTDAGEMRPPEMLNEGDADYSGGTFFQSGYTVLLKGSPETIWPAIRQIGGQHGWYYGDLFWKIRGLVDRLVGGFGLWRGRRHPDELWVGEVLDFWRVLEFSPPAKMILLSERRQSGDSVLSFELTPRQYNTELKIINHFQPRTWVDFIYWFSSQPLRNLLVKGMLKGISETSACRMLKRPSKLVLGQ